jgi:hypothetical protein
MGDLKKMASGAVRNGDLDLLINCLDQHPELLQWQDGCGRTLLMRAAYGLRVNIVQYLIGVGSDPMVKDIFDQTFICHAVRRMVLSSTYNRFSEDKYARYRAIQQIFLGLSQPAPVSLTNTA